MNRHDRLSSGEEKQECRRLQSIRCGTKDTLMAATGQLRDWLKSRGIEATNVDLPGGHTWMVFRRNLAVFARSAIQIRI
jgi:hypothetical protein